MSLLILLAGVVCCPLFLVLIVVVLLYNSLVGKKNQCENVFASLDAMLKKRYDLIPNLVATVQGYMQHERETLTKITELRGQAISPQASADAKVGIDNQVSKLLGGLMISVEKYPDLKASRNFLQLQASLNDIEEQIAAARRAYNAMVTEYNNAVEMVPTNILAGMMGYQRRALFEIGESERAPVSVGGAFTQGK